jgi:hypothetical protein
VLNWILIAVAAIVVVFIAMVALQPADFRVQRSALIAAPTQAVFAQVNDFHNWRAWSPWEMLDPQLERTYAGPQAGTGASYAWAGNKDVGEGRMTITESRPGERILIDLQFIKPMTARNTTEFLFKPEGGGTAVTWTMSGRHNFMGKAFSLLMNIDRMVGGQFEQGLANMKSLVEGRR